jgi:hypothetical protein
MARAMKNPYRTIRNLLLQRECRLVDSILAAAQDDGRALHARIMIRGVRRLEGQELADNRVEVGLRVALGEPVGEVYRQRRLAKRRAQVLEGVIPAIADAPVCVLLVQTVAAATSPGWRSQHGEMQVLACIVRRLAQAPKDRSADLVMLAARHHDSLSRMRDLCSGGRRSPAVRPDSSYLRYQRQPVTLTLQPAGVSAFV